MPDGSWGTAAATASALRTIYDELAACADLRPSPHVDAVFRRLVRLVVGAPVGVARGVLADPAVRGVVPQLRSLCFEAEYQLELGWASRIAESAAPEDELGQFPYVENYRLLHELERDALDRFAEGVAVERVALVGSGPLPLTSLLLASDPGVHVANFERDPVALGLSRRLAETLGATRMVFHRVDVGAGSGDVDLGCYDLVVLAALVGRTAGEKAHVIRHLAVKMAPGALLLARSAQGLRSVLYPEVEVGALAALDVLGVVHPTNDVINSVIVARKPRA
jgi:Nicotianamine synthase protein